MPSLKSVPLAHMQSLQMLQITSDLPLKSEGGIGKEFEMDERIRGSSLDFAITT